MSPSKDQQKRKRSTPRHALINQIDLVEFNKIYPVTPMRKLIEKYGRSESSIRNLAKKFSLKRLDNPGCFKKGHNPANAGKTGFSHPGSVKTQFPKGHKPANTLKDGAITIRNERDFKTGNRRKILMIRISEGRWEYLHRWIWQQHNGPIPAKHCVRFIDGDQMHCSIDNLELITMAENARRNKNYEKASQSHRANWEEGISDRHVASYIVGADKDLQQQLIQERPDIISLKRTQFELKRTIDAKTA